MERFKEFTNDKPGEGENHHVKSAIKYGCNAKFITQAHSPNVLDGKSYYDSLFRQINFGPFNENTHGKGTAILNHYLTKSLQEYFYRKYQSKRADCKYHINSYTKEYFLDRCTNDKEKMSELFDKYFDLWKRQA
jgi:hypothetical protein